jgi:hypothetical protein
LIVIPRAFTMVDTSPLFDKVKDKLITEQLDETAKKAFFHVEGNDAVKEAAVGKLLEGTFSGKWKLFLWIVSYSKGTFSVEWKRFL